MSHRNPRHWRSNNLQVYEREDVERRDTEKEAHVMKSALESFGVTVEIGKEKDVKERYNLEKISKKILEK